MFFGVAQALLLLPWPREAILNTTQTLTKPIDYRNIVLIKIRTRFKMDIEMEGGQNHEIAMTNASMTIDPTVVQSRILQSSSLAQAAAEGQDSDDDMDGTDQPVFPKLNAMAERGGKIEYRRIRCPKHRYTPLRNDWEQILMPLVQFLKLQVSRYAKIQSDFAESGQLEIHVYIYIYIQSSYKSLSKNLSGSFQHKN